MAHAHDHSVDGANKERQLWLALLLTATYLVAEVIGGLITGSLALLSDAAHMASDIAALAIALAALRVGKRPADKKRTFGYYRFEILAAAVNAVGLFFIALYILYQACQRFFETPEIQSLGMLVVASVGLVVNLISMRILAAGKDASLNVKGAYLEVWSDLLGSIGVIAAALILQITGWRQVDPIVAVAIGLWVLPRAWMLLKDSTNILLEGVPEGIELREIESTLAAIAGVREVHELHVWAITSGKNSLTAHLVIDPDLGNPQTVLEAGYSLLKDRFAILHSTIQIETAACQTNRCDGSAGGNSSF